MLLVICVYPEFAHRGRVLLCTRSNRCREYQLPIFIGAEELFRKINENEFCLRPCCFIVTGHRRIISYVIDLYWNFQIHSRMCMTPVYPVKPGNVLPPVPEQALESFTLQ